MRLLVTVAHPDDEAFGCGSLLAHAASLGADITVACATRGELGEPVGAAAAERPSRERVGEIREAELRAATALLGVRRVELLGWRDSGVDGAPEDGSLAAAPATEVEAAIARLVDDVRPHVVVTLDASDGHRDHAVVRDATLAAVSGAAWRVERTYLWCLPRSLMAEFTGVDTLGTPDDEITAVIDTSAQLDVRWRAMRAHASQSPPYDAMDPDLQRRFLTADHLVQVDPPWAGGPVERELTHLMRTTSAGSARAGSRSDEPHVDPPGTARTAPAVAKRS